MIGPAVALGVALLAPARAQFGQNHVVVRDFDWKIRSTEHFDIYYYEGSEPLVPQAAKILEDAFANVAKKLEIDLEPPAWASASARKKYRWDRRPFFLYASPNDFEQSNIAQVGDGTGGITEPFKNRFMVYNNGERQWLDQVITHEFTHIMQYYLLVSGFWRSGRILKTIVYPLWMIEGMPDYVTDYVDAAIEETLVRDAATSDGLIPLTRLEHFGHLKPHQILLGYHEGAEAMAFLASQFGERKLGDILRLFESRIETNQVLMELIGLDEQQFDAKFREFTEAKYWRIVREQRLREPTSFGGQLTRTGDNVPQFNSAPVFTPDGKTLYYLSTRRDLDPPEVWQLDVATGRQRKAPGIPFVPIENIPMGNFANLSRTLSISRGGRFLAFAGTKNHRDHIFLYDIRGKKLRRLSPPGFQTINQPAFSPDGRSIAFSGMKAGATDIYLYDLNSGEVSQVTDDPNDDQMPAFSPDGKSVIYSQEIIDPLGRKNYDRRLVRVNLRSLAVEPIADVGAQSRDPVVSNDGRRVLFARDDGHFSELCELDLRTGRVAQLTRTIGGAFTPTYGPGGQVAFASMRRGNVHLYMGPRSDFLDEPLSPGRRVEDEEAKFSLPGMGGLTPSTSTVTLTAPRPYRFDYSTDLFLPAFFYSSVGGFFWTSYWQGSDMTGNHQDAALVSISGHDYQYQADHVYSRYRPTVVASARGLSYHDLIDANSGHDVNDSYNVQSIAVLYPFDRYHRVEAGLESAEERVIDNTDGSLTANRQARFSRVALVRDTVTGRYLVATRGNRAQLAWTQAAQALGGNQRFGAVSLEGHQFVPLGAQTTFATRAFLAQTGGADQAQLILGGLGGVRGFGRSTIDNVGNRLAVANAEFRFPIGSEINYYMWYFFPDFYFKALFGTLFADTGYAWNSQGDINQAHWSTLRTSVGAGVRLYTFILQQYPLVVTMDYARRTTSPGGIFYVYLGQLF